MQGQVLGAAAAVWKRAKRHTALLHEAGYLLLGLVSLATATGLYFLLDVPLVAAAFTYLVVLVLLSLVSNLSSLIVLSFIGVSCLSYFFAPPIYSFRVDYPQDLITISAFVITSFVVNLLVTRVRAEQRDHMRTCETLRDANQRLEVTNEALRIENVERKGPSKHCENSSSNRQPSRKYCAPLRTRRTTCNPSSTPSSTAPNVFVEQTWAACVSSKKAAFVSWGCEGTPFWLIRCGHHSQCSTRRVFWVD